MNASTIPNGLDIPTAEREHKLYATLAAQFALHGLELIKGDPEIAKQAPYFATRHGRCTPLDSLDAALVYLMSSLPRGHGQDLQAQ